MKIFLIAGKAESGKGEVAKFIKEFYIYKHEQSVITEYAKYIKLFAKELSDWDGNENTKPRKYLQDVGKKIRDINPDYLINNMLQDFEIYKEYAKNIIISDVRMPEEIDKIRNAYDDVYAINVENQYAPSNLSIEEQIDVTELALESYNDFDYILVNDNLELLKDKIFNILEEIK